MAQWYAVIDGSNQLVSVGTVVSPGDDLVQAGYSAVELPGPPDFENNLWDPTRLEFVPIQTIDRVEEFISDDAVQAVWNNLTAAQQDGLRQALTNLLGTQRYRNQNQHPSL